MDRRDAAAAVGFPAAAQPLLDALPDPALVIDGACRVIAVNDAWREQVAGDPEAQGSFLGRDYRHAARTALGWRGEAAERCLQGVRAVLRGEVPAFRFEDGPDAGQGGHWTRTTVTPFDLAGSRVALVIHGDISAARSAEARFSQLLESPLDALLLVDEQGAIRMVNAQMEAQFGYPRDVLLGRDLTVLLPERFRERHRHHLLSYFRDPHPRPMGIGLELYALHHDGHELPVEIALTPLETGARPLISAAIRDLSRLQRAEQALRKSELRMALHVRNTPLAVVEWDVTDGTVTAWNPAAERMFGYRAVEVIGKLKADIVMPAGEWRPAAGYLMNAGEPVRSLRHTPTRDGRELVCEWYSTPLADKRGEVVAVAALALDVTARQRALETMLNAQEEERGRISRDLHDQVGQALTWLMMGLTQASSDPAPERLEELRETVGQTLEEVRRISRDLRPAMLDELGLEAAIRRFARELAEGGKLGIDLLVRPPAGLARNAQIVVYRVVQEGLTNVARHAEASRASVVVTHRHGEVQLVVEDDGCGFDPAALRPGESFGLTGMRERLELLGGSLDVDSAEGRGTILTGRFPLRGVGRR